MKINFNNKEIELRFSFRADMIYENIQNKSFAASSETEWLVYFYSTYLAITDDTELSFDDCVKLLDEEPSVLFQFISWYIDFQEKNLKLIPHDKEDEKKQ